MKGRFRCPISGAHPSARTQPVYCVIPSAKLRTRPQSLQDLHHLVGDAAGITPVQSINKLHNRLRGCMKGPQPLHMQIRSGDMCGARGRSLPRPVGDSGKRSAGNRKERHGRDFASSPEGCKPLPISFSGRARSAQENDVFRFPFPLQGCDSRLAATDRRQHFVDGLNRHHAGFDQILCSNSLENRMSRAGEGRRSHLRATLRAIPRTICFSSSFIASR